MTALWIILAIALVLTLLNLLPVGVDAAYAEGAFSLAARIGPARLHLLPKAPDAKPGKAKTKKPKKKKEKKKSAPPDAQTLLKLAELGLQALDRLRQKLHVRLLRLIFVQTRMTRRWRSAVSTPRSERSRRWLSGRCASTSGTFRPAWILTPSVRASTHASSARSASGRSSPSH